MKKDLITIIIVIIAVIIIGLLLYFFDPIKKYVVYQKALLGLSGSEAILVVDNGQQERMFKGEIVDGMTVADVLDASDLAVLTNSNNIDWDCSLNGKKIEREINEQVVRARDRIVCRYR